MFEVCGNYSLGICLVHILVNYFIIRLGLNFVNWEIAIIVIVSILLGIVYEKIVNSLYKQITIRKLT
jgi:peptidoglycan/LPS O-acetylase OafA/YrhL